MNDFSPNENTFSNDVNMSGRTLYSRGVRAFTDYAPVRWTARDGLYRTVRWGRNAELFFLDQRSFRSAKADEGGVCNNPQSGEPDLAPTAPQRSSGSLRADRSRRSPSRWLQACLDAIRSPDRTYLGQRQLTRFLRAIKRSNARFKIVMNELPIQQYYALPYDRWEGYEFGAPAGAARAAGVKNVIFLTTDVHATLVNDARFQTLEDGGTREQRDPGRDGRARRHGELRARDRRRRRPVRARARSSTRSSTSPPRRTVVGMQCSVVDQFSYGQVSVSATQLVVTPKGIDGKQQRNGDKPCGPFVLNYEK